MIKKLKIRFIILAMASLTVLLSVIVAGMNIASYQKVVSDADARIEVLGENSAMLLSSPDFEEGDQPVPPDKPGNGKDSGGPGAWREDEDKRIFGRRGEGGPSMSRDEAEESRFFIVTVNEDGEVEQSNTSKIAAVDSDEASEYAEKALASGEDKGFVDDFRYAVSKEADGTKTIIFLDCGRVLASFRSYLKYSILMSLAGLLVMLGVITYFAGRIVKPVAESYEKQKRFITDAGHEIKTPLAIIKANIDLMDMELESASGAGSAVSPSGGLGEDSLAMPSVGLAEDHLVMPSVGLGEDSVKELKESLGDINDQVDRLTGLTNDLVYLSRMEEAGNTLVMTEVPLSEVTSESVSAFEPLAAEKGVGIAADIAPMITVKGSLKELEKLLSILLENAVKYSAAPALSSSRSCGDPALDGGSPAPGGGSPAPGGGSPAPGGGSPAPGGGSPAPGGDRLAPGDGSPAPGGDRLAPGDGSPAPSGDRLAPGGDLVQKPSAIDVSLKKEGRNAVLRIRNETEEGLTNEGLSHVFERFYRTDSSRNSETGGHGIGLSMAQAIVNAHGGRISAHTATGCDFIITAVIPLA